MKNFLFLLSLSFLITIFIGTITFAQSNFADFESYATGDLNGQDGWSNIWNSLQVQNETVFDGVMAIKNRMDYGGLAYKELPVDFLKEGVVSAKIRIDNNSFSDNQDILGLYKGIGEDFIALFRFANNFNDLENTLLISVAGSSDARDLGQITQGEWHNISLGWRNSDFKIRVKVDTGDWTEWFDSQTRWNEGEPFGVRITLPSAREYGDFYIDNFKSSIGEDIISSPAPTTLHVIKIVINGSIGTSTASDFIIRVTNSGAGILGDPVIGMTAPGILYTLYPGTYVVSEEVNPFYTQSFSGDCDATGTIILAVGDDKICTIIDTDIPPPVGVEPSIVPGDNTGTEPTIPEVPEDDTGVEPIPPVVPEDNAGTEPVPEVAPVVPLIGILKVPTSLILPEGSNTVTYNYTLWNVGGTQALVNVTLTDDKCSSIIFLSGDTNNDSRLDSSEDWKYSCTMTLSTTTTNTAVATGYNDSNQVAIATALATVVVDEPIPGLPETGFIPPLINIVKVPNRLTPLPQGGGDVIYSYTVTNPGLVPMNNIIVSDDKCAPVSRISGDINNNNLLEPSESWSYTCKTNVKFSTRNVATAIGKANGLTALSYAFATVLVALPNPHSKDIIIIILVVIILILISSLIILFPRLRRGFSEHRK